MTNNETLKKLNELSRKKIIFPKYLMHQSNGSFKETASVLEYEAYKGPKMIVAVLESSI